MAANRSSSSKSAMGGKAFSDATFDVHRYLSNRPRYPPHLYDLIRKYIISSASSSSSDTGGGGGLLLDIGCGPGFASFPLLSGEGSEQGEGRHQVHFDTLVGVDTSAAMVASAPRAFEAYTTATGTCTAGETSPSASPTRVDFQVGNSASMPFLKDHSVALAIAATAAHWFEYKSTWIELTRVVAPGGAVVWWTYGEHFLPDHWRLQPLINHFMQGSSGSSKDNDDDDNESIGAYFEQPGRSRLNNLLRDLPFPHDPSLELGEEITSQWDDSTALRVTHPMEDDSTDSPVHSDQGGGRVAKVDLSYYASTTLSQRQTSPAQPFRLEQVMSWDQYEGYIRTSSALHSYLKVHPHDQDKIKGGEGDIASRFVNRLKGKVLEDRRNNHVGTEEGLDEGHVRVAWPLGLMAIKKKQK